MSTVLYTNDWYDVRALSARTFNEQSGLYTNYAVINSRTGVLEKLCETLPEAVFLARIMCRDLDQLLDDDIDDQALDEMAEAKEVH